ncbi:hypothetical protein [Sorangium sp. So ce542]|uniref:hypothetical protein n=1 Tax=Sorangium sp. So ce542 TaxID=3133316 RepID=UPI003F60ED6B
MLRRGARGALSGWAKIAHGPSPSPRAARRTNRCGIARSGSGGPRRHREAASRRRGRERGPFGADRSAYSCNGGRGGDGGEGGYGDPGRGGDSIGIAYLDEDRLTALGVTFTLGPPGKGGISWDEQGEMFSGEDGIAVEMRRFPE